MPELPDVELYVNSLSELLVGKTINRAILKSPFLPNEMPRVAGIITAVRQTPLSHVDLRAIQDRIAEAHPAER